MTKTYQLVIRNGRVVSSKGTEVSDVAIENGVVAALGDHPSGERVIDATGLLVLPGGVDTHVHLTPLPQHNAVRRPDDFVSGSRAALKGGITTIGNMTHQRKGSGLIASLRPVRAEAERNCLIDFILHPVLNEPNPKAMADIGLLRENGYSTLKLFMVFEEFERRPETYLDAMRFAASSDVLVLVHCEDPAIIRRTQSELALRGEHSVEHYVVSRPEESEIAAVERALAMAGSTGSRIQIVHLCSHEALSRCVSAKQQGVSVFVETRPLYLHLTEAVFSREDAAKYVGNPPPRSEQNRQALWQALASGSIDTVASDHAPWTLEQKLESGADLRTALPGVSELETMLPMLFSEGVVTGRISVDRFIELTARVPAAITGLGRTKGDIQIGFDADLVIWDPEQVWAVNGSEMESKAGYSPYDGWEVTGKPVYTISRGMILMEPDGIPDRVGYRGRLATSAQRGASNDG